MLFMALDRLASVHSCYRIAILSFFFQVFENFTGSKYMFVLTRIFREWFNRVIGNMYVKGIVDPYMCSMCIS